MSDTDDLSGSPLRQNGIYRYAGLNFTAINLSTDNRPWDVTGLVHIEPGSRVPRELLYLRHADRVLLDGATFAPIGTLADLTDTGETDHD